MPAKLKVFAYGIARAMGGTAQAAPPPLPPRSLRTCARVPVTWRCQPGVPLSHRPTPRAPCVLAPSPSPRPARAPPTRRHGLPSFPLGWTPGYRKLGERVNGKGRRAPHGVRASLACATIGAWGDPALRGRGVDYSRGRGGHLNPVERARWWWERAGGPDWRVGARAVGLVGWGR